MPRLNRIIFTVTNDLNYDQRMIRICNSLARAGYQVTLVGVLKKNSTPLQAQSFKQKRLYLFCSRGMGFYAEYNLRLFFYLLFQKKDIICAIDLDSIIPVWLVSTLSGKKRVYDAHEYFSQQKEVISRPRIYRVWHWIEKTFIPRFKAGYTVSSSIASAFEDQYGVHYEVIRNMPLLKTPVAATLPKAKTLLYQGAVNEARGLEFLVPAMKKVDATLLIYGEGNIMATVKALISLNNLSDKLLLKGKCLPGELESITQNAYIGINLVENNGLNQYFSLANKFFDYLHQEVPQVTMNFPEYKKLNDEYEVAILLEDLEEATISKALNRLLNEQDLYDRLKQNCAKAREAWNWQAEEKKLLAFYEQL